MDAAAPRPRSAGIAPAWVNAAASASYSPPARRPTAWAFLSMTTSKVDDPWPGADAREESPGGLGRCRNGLAPGLMSGAGLFKAMM